MAYSAATPLTNVYAFLHLKLDRHNYPLWRAQFVPLLRSRSLMPFVDGMSKCPPAFLLDDEGQLTDNINPNFEPLYENTVASIQARETPISYAALEALLLSAETHHLTFTLSGDTLVPTMIAMAANRGCRVHAPAGFACGRGQAGVPHCGGFAFCPNENVAGPHQRRPGVLGVGPSFADRPSLKCQICRRNGHSAIDCYNCMNTSYEGYVPSARLTTFAAQSHRVSQAPTAPINWLLDSGANAHITNDPCQFTNA